MKNSGKTGKQQEKETLRNNIRDHILKSIMDGTYKAGDRIVETRLAKELDVSQAPVREAILELSVMGLLEEKPYSGTFVKAITADDLEDMFHCRAIIEEYSARQAARRATAQQLKCLGAILDDMSSSRDIQELTVLDKNFHEAIMDAAGSPAMKNVWRNLRMAEWTYISAANSALSIDEIVSQHRIIYDFINSRDEESAGAYMYLHIQHFGRELVQAFIRKNYNPD
jgi:DNA-binding GntR family transcriptional regulator